MHIDIVVALEKYTQGSLSVTAEVRAGEGEHSFTLAALAPGTGVSVSNWRPRGAEARVEGTQVRATGPVFGLLYDVAIPHKVCLGSGREVELLYPFLNSGEIFFGTGVLPVPGEACTASLRLSGLPAGWSEFSSLTPGGMHAEKLPAFFCYCAPGLAPALHTWHGQSQDVVLRILTQRGRTLPMPEQALFDFFDGYMTWLERSIAPYRRAKEINFLVLQASADYDSLAGGRTFASGENVLNGIACYAPSDTGHLESYFGYSSYAQYLYEGLAHELLHLYTSAVFDVPAKTVLYPSPGCAAYAVRLLGDALNIYFCTQYVSEHVPEARGSFEKWLARVRVRQEKTGARQPLLDLQALDAHLRAAGSSLLALFREMVLLRLDDRRPYESAGFLFETMRSRLHIEPPEALEKGILSQS